MTDNSEKRRHKRVPFPYVIKFRSLASNAPKSWNAVRPVNVSESGICFLTEEQFIPGTDMFLLVTNPELAQEKIYDCTVRRSDRAGPGSPLFATAVTIEHIDEDVRQAYRKILKAFVKDSKEEWPPED